MFGPKGVAITDIGTFALPIPVRSLNMHKLYLRCAGRQAVGVTSTRDLGRGELNNSFPAYEGHQPDDAVDSGCPARG